MSNKPTRDVTKETNSPFPAASGYGPGKPMPQVEPPARVGHPVGKNENPKVLNDPPAPERSKLGSGSDRLPRTVSHDDIKATARRLGYGRW
jgi:hypothetical protein